MSDSEWITLNEAEIAFADGVARDKQADSVDRPPTNGAPSNPETALAFHILGARCEHAVNNFLTPVLWNYKPGLFGVPDFDNFIDVKGRALTDYDMMVQRKSHADWAYILVIAEHHPRYEIVAWCWGSEAMGEPLKNPAKRGGPVHLIPRNKDIMKPPELLRRELRKRQAARAIRAGMQFEFISGVWP